MKINLENNERLILLRFIRGELQKRHTVNKYTILLTLKDKLIAAKPVKPHGYKELG